jgi:two-component system NtrC family sensor kinase
MIFLKKRDKVEQDERYYQLLIRKMVLIVIVVSFTPLLLISGTILYSFSVSYHEKVIAQLQELVLKHKQNIDSFLNERLADIRTMATSYGIDDLSNETTVNRLLEMLKEEHQDVYVDLGLIDDQGLQIAYAGPFQLAQANYLHADWFSKATQRDEFISDVFLGLRGSPHFIVAVTKHWQGRKWILRATVDFEAFNSLVEGVRIGKTGIAFILNQKGEFQTRQHLEIVPNRAPYLKYLKSENLSEAHLNVVEEANDLGQPYIQVMTPLKDGEWILAFQQHKQDAFSDLYRARKLAVIIFSVGGLCIFFTALILSKRMVRRIQKADLAKRMMNEQVIEAGRLASLGELAAGIAHEINNPVAIMVEEAGWIEDLLEEEDFKQGENLDEFRRAVTQIRNQGTRCKEITHKLLSFARKTDPQIQEIQLNDVIQEVVGVSEQRARFSNVKITTHLPPELPAVHVSPTEMQQVFLNLVNNALDAMNQKGGKLDITSRSDGQFAIVDVSDTGLGIPEAIMQRLFDPFFTTKPVGKGTGLGLSICYGIIEKLGGKITVNSAVGVGTIFHVWIPLPDKDHRRSPASAQNAGKAMKLQDQGVTDEAI